MGDYCSSKRSSYASAASEAESAAEQIISRARSLEWPCGLQTEPMVPGMTEKQVRVCQLYRSQKGRMADEYLLSQCSKMMIEEMCRKCLE